jgi:hypothetical protein
MIINSNNGLAAYYKIEKHQADDDGIEIPGTRETVADWFPNLITNAGLDFLSSNGFIVWCGLGSGSTAPAFTDTALQTPVGARKSGSVAQGPSGGTIGTSDYYSSIVGTYVFEQNTVVGNLSEICTAPLATGSVFSRALILDGGGAPTTITVTPIDILTVTYQLRLYRSITDIAGSFDIGGVTHDTVTRAALVGADNLSTWNSYGPRADAAGSSRGMISFTGALGAVTSTPASTSGTGTGPGTLPAYTPGSYYRDTVISATVGQLNAAGGIAALATWNGAGAALPFQVSFSPVLPKDDTKTLTATIRSSWARYTP